MARSEFWVVYDYGMGGAWGLARAASSEEVTRVFPELEVVDERPEWMTEEAEKEVRRNSSFVVSDPQTYPKWVQTLIDER